VSASGTGIVVGTYFASHPRNDARSALASDQSNALIDPLGTFRIIGLPWKQGCVRMPPMRLNQSTYGAFSYRNWISSSLDIRPPARVYDISTASAKRQSRGN
jgi:hypothetical protein